MACTRICSVIGWPAHTCNVMPSIFAATMLNNSEQAIHLVVETGVHRVPLLSLSHTKGSKIEIRRKRNVLRYLAHNPEPLQVQNDNGRELQSQHALCCIG